jgi:hypothetical protein
VAAVLAKGIVGYSGVCDDPRAYDTMSTSKWTTTGPLAGATAASARRAAAARSSMSAGADSF